jgi:hypothetical protein
MKPQFGGFKARKRPLSGREKEISWLVDLWNLDREPLHIAQTPLWIQEKQNNDAEIRAREAAEVQAEIDWLEQHVNLREPPAPDPVLSLMEMLDIPLTKENWISISTMGGTEADMDAEELSEMPACLQEQEEE